MKRLLRLSELILVFLTVVSLSNCTMGGGHAGGGGGGGGGSASVAFKTKISTLGAGQSYQFWVNTKGDQNAGVTFAVSPDSAHGGGTVVNCSAQPCISANYIAPVTPPAGGQVTITATDNNGSGANDTDSFTITAAPGPVVSITPAYFTASAAGSPVTLNISVTQDNSSDTLTGITNQGSMGYYSGTPGGGSYTVKYYPPLQLSQSARGTLNVSSSLPNSTMGTAIVDVSPGGGGGASNAICKPQGSENQLSGAWTFLLKGLSTVNQAQQGTSRLAIAASFVADGKGGITSGIADYASTAKGGSLQSFTVNPSSSSGSSYSLDSTGHGCLALVVSSGGTMASRTFNIVMAGYSNGVPTSGQIMEFDAANYQELSTGFIMPGNSGSVSNASLNGSFTFGLEAFQHSAATALRTLVETLLLMGKEASTPRTPVWATPTTKATWTRLCRLAKGRTAWPPTGAARFHSPSDVSR